MLKKYKDKREEGFTIIEVLIVLAIAGLIILIVFLAVPALQRNSRNTSRRNDVSKVGGTIQEIMNNNNGDPTAVTAALVDDAIGSNLAYYDFDLGGAVNLVVDDVVGTNSETEETIHVVQGAKCDGANTTNTNVSSRQFAIEYAVESGTTGSPTTVCQDV